MNLWLIDKYRPCGGDIYNNTDRNRYFKNYLSVNSTATTPYFADSTWVGGFATQFDTMPTNYTIGEGKHQMGKFIGRFAIWRHHKRINVAKMDGSAETRTVATIRDYTWNAQEQ